MFVDIERLILGFVWACLVTFLSHLRERIALLILLKSGARRSDLKQAAIVDLNQVFATLWLWTALVASLVCWGVKTIDEAV